MTTVPRSNGPTLAAVIDHYDGGGVARPSRAPEVRPLHLTADEKRALLAFLGTLTGENQPVTVPIDLKGIELP